MNVNLYSYKHCIRIDIDLKLASSAYTKGKKEKIKSVKKKRKGIKKKGLKRQTSDDV